MYRLLPDTECLHLNLSVTFGYSYTVRDSERYDVEENSQSSQSLMFFESQVNITDEPT